MNKEERQKLLDLDDEFREYIRENRKTREHWAYILGRKDMSLELIKSLSEVLNGKFATELIESIKNIKYGETK